MGYFKVKELEKEHISPYNVKKYLFDMIQEEFGYGYIPKYHQDINDLEIYYIKPEKNNFFLAINQESQKLIGTIGIRAYDRNFARFKEVYTPEKTASIWRVFISKPWRRKGVGSTLVHISEEFCRKKGYHNVYLHTHKIIPGSLNFWLKNGYRIVEDTGDHLKTVHMEKNL